MRILDRLFVRLLERDDDDEVLHRREEHDLVLVRHRDHLERLLGDLVHREEILQVDRYAAVVAAAARRAREEAVQHQVLRRQNVNGVVRQRRHGDRPRHGRHQRHLASKRTGMRIGGIQRECLECESPGLGPRVYVVVASRHSYMAGLAHNARSFEGLTFQLAFSSVKAVRRRFSKESFARD